MQSLNEVFQRPSAFDSIDNYFGQTEFDGLHVLLGRNRESAEDPLNASNWHTALKRLQGESENVQIVRFGHWACGWIEYLCVKAETAQFIEAEKIEKELDGYPVLDDEDHSERETIAADEIWKNCYSDSERVQYVREHNNQFSFHSFADLRAVIRGEYFSGYASELIY